MSRKIQFAVALLLILSGTAAAHVGSPDVFYDGQAGPYRLFVTVTMPAVIPGVAEIAIRSESPEVREITSTVTTLSGVGAEFAPTPDTARHSPRDPNSFSSSLWLMQPGALRIRLLIDGNKGKAELSVPLPAYAQRTLAMDAWIRVVLIVMLLTLCVSMVSIIRAALREGGLGPEQPVTQLSARRGAIGAVVTTMIVSALLLGGVAWWHYDAQVYAAERTFFEPPKISASLVDGGLLRLDPADQRWSKTIRFDDLIADHGHLMHLFLVRDPGLDRMWHLHPLQKDGGFEQRLPTMPAGRYRVFADIVDKSGFPWTMVGVVDLPEVAGGAPTGDDCGVSVPETIEGDRLPVFELSDGATVTWQKDERPIKARVPLFLKFQVYDPNGNPANDLQPYMGMAAHAEIVRSDFTVFAHVHPSGSIPMASLMLASSAGTTSHRPMIMADERIGPEVSFPYGFPKPGTYRIFLHIKRGGHIQTAAFDAQVR